MRKIYFIWLNLNLHIVCHHKIYFHIEKMNKISQLDLFKVSISRINSLIIICIKGGNILTCVARRANYHIDVSQMNEIICLARTVISVTFAKHPSKSKQGQLFSLCLQSRCMHKSYKLLIFIRLLLQQMDKKNNRT